MVERVDDERTNEASSQEDDGVDQSNNPLVAAWPVNAEILGERQVGAIGASLIPSGFSLAINHTQNVVVRFLETAQCHSGTRMIIVYRLSRDVLAKKSQLTPE